MIKYCFFIPGRLPGMNEIVAGARGNKYASAAQKEKHTKRIAGHVRMMLMSRRATIKGNYIVTIQGKVWVDLKWMEKNRRRDPDNVCAGKKFILDGLILAGLLKNDGWNQIAGFTDTWEVGEPGVWVEVREM